MEPCTRQDPLLLQQPAPQTLFGCEFVLSVWTLRDENTVDTGQEPTELSWFFLFLDRYWQQVSKMVLTWIVSMNFLLRCQVAPSSTIRNPKVWSPIFIDPWSKKLRSPNSSALSTHAWSVWSRHRWFAGWTCLYHMLVKVINLSRNVHVNCSLLELCSRHEVMLQVKVLQVANIR